MKEIENRLEALNVDFELCKRELDQTRSKLVTQAAYDHLEKTQNDLNHQIASLSKKNEENMRLLDQKEEKIQQMEKKIKCLQGMNTFKLILIE